MTRIAIVIVKVGRGQIAREIVCRHDTADYAGRGGGAHVSGTHTGHTAHARIGRVAFFYRYQADRVGLI